MHHANIIINRGDCREAIFEILEKNLDFRASANPDFLLIERESLGIDDARDLERWAIGKSFSGGAKASLLIAGSITREAQNALLKILEEPPSETYIFISLESLGGILPTLISRVRILDIARSPENLEVQAEDAGSKFLHSDISKKLALIRFLSKKEDKSGMREMIKDLEEIAYKNHIPYPHLRELLTAKIFASARGSSPKMLLEWLSCVL